MNFENAITTLKTELILTHRKPETTYSFRNLEDQNRIAQKIQNIVLEIVKSIVRSEPPCLKTIDHSDRRNCFFDDRELYYENINIFDSQSEVDAAVRDVCYIVGVPCWELGVVATLKGIVSGPLELKLSNGEVINCNKSEGVSVPLNITQVDEVSSAATWVLIIEKDAAFQKLLPIRASKLESCILITGKGYPDVNTRILVCKLWHHLQIPIFALVDADPHGFEIMSVYRFGSTLMSSYATHLACPAVRWLGVHPSDIDPLLLDSKPLSLRDVRKTRKLLKRSYVAENEHFVTQLNILLENNVKAEIEGVSGISTNYLTDVYLRNKILVRDYY